MNRQLLARGFVPNPSENYQRYFVPAIGAPLARTLVDRAGLQPGERVLDVACGTGVVTRLAAEKVGERGTVAGLDVMPPMLGTASQLSPEGVEIDWYEASAEAMPLPDAAFDVVLCQMGLQFVANKPAAVREMHRVLVPDGRVLISTPGPSPEPLRILADIFTRHVGPEAGGFLGVVFSLHDEAELRGLLDGAGFEDVLIERATPRLELPPPRDFLWQYVNSTPLMEKVMQAGEDRLAEIESEVAEKWQPFVDDGQFAIDVPMTTSIGRR